MPVSSWVGRQLDGFGLALPPPAPPIPKTTTDQSGILCGHPLTGVGRFPNLAGCPAGPASTVAGVQTMHRSSPAKLPDLPNLGERTCL